MEHQHITNSLKTEISNNQSTQSKPASNSESEQAAQSNGAISSTHIPIFVNR